MKYWIIALSLALACLNVQSKDIWINDSWGNDLIKGLWEGCTAKTLEASGYEEKNGPITGIEFRDSKDPLLMEIKNGCNCQTKFFQENYSIEELKSTLKLKSTNEKYKQMMAKVWQKCF